MASQAPPPSKGSPAGVPSGGNGKYIVLAILLLGLIGGVIVWKITQKPPAPVVQYVDAAPPPKPTIDDQDIPLPVPIKDAGEEDAGEKPPVKHTRTNQCEVKRCRGKASSDLQTALAFRAKQSHRCYDTALAQDPTLRGKVSISVRVGALGQVCSAGVANNELATPSVAKCVAGYFRGQSFPAPSGGCVDVNIPINFVPRQ